MPDDLSAEALPGSLIVAVYETNLLARAAILMGIPVRMDVVDDPYPRIVLRVGDAGVPPIERAKEGRE